MQHLQKTRGEGPLLTGRHSVPLAIPHLLGSRNTCHGTQVTGHAVRPIRPIADKRLWCNNSQRHGNSSRSGETTPLPPVSNTSERTSGTVRQCSRSETPIRLGLQVVPGSSVLKLDRSRVARVPIREGWVKTTASAKGAGKCRVGKAGSVRLG